jgi:hypothetical protein
MELHLSEVERKFGEFHLFCLYPLHALSNFLYRYEKYKEAVPHLIRTLLTLKAAEAHKFADVSEPHFKLAYSYMALGLLDEAEKVANQGLRIARWRCNNEPSRTVCEFSSHSIPFYPQL